MSSAPHSGPSHAPSGAAFWSGLIVGGAIIAFGVRGLLMNLRLNRVINLATFFGASGIAHDALWAPLLVGGGLATMKLPVSIRRTVRIGLFLSAALVLFAAPLLHGYDGRDSNPSALPLAYGRNTSILLIGLWAVVAVAAVRQVRIRRATP